MPSRATLVVLLGALAAFAASQAAFSAPGRVADTATAAAPAPPARRTSAHTVHRARGFLVARLRRKVALRTRPGGRARLWLAPRTEFGSPRVLSVAVRRGRWLGVVTSELPNGTLGWVRRGDRSLGLRRVATSLRADLSSRTLELRRNGRTIRRLRVAVGREGSPTPTGRFAVTDRLEGSRFGPYYGCCVLALSGHQPAPPAGWQGGNRLAIHGTDAPSTVGSAASAGCLRATDAGLEALMRRVPLGTPLFIRS